MAAGQYTMGQAPTTNLEQVTKMEVCKYFKSSPVIVWDFASHAENDPRFRTC